MRTIKQIKLVADGISQKVFALFDTGATLNFIKKEVGQKFATRMTLPETFEIGLGGKKQKISELMAASVEIRKFRMPSQNFYLADIKKIDAIIGAFFMEQWGIVLGHKSKKLKIKKKWLQLQEEF